MRLRCASAGAEGAMAREMASVSVSMAGSDGLFEEAYAAHAAGRLDDACCLYQLLLERNPEHADATHMLGALLVQRYGNAREREAMELLQAAIHMRPGCARFRHSLGVLHQACGRHMDAIDAFDRANEKDPMNVQVLLDMAKALKSVKRYARAAEVYRSVLLMEPDHPKAYYRRGTCLRKVGRTEAALASFRQHLMLCPNDKGASFWVAVLSGDCSGMAAMPADMVARLFDGYADNFDAHLVEKLNYRTPQIIMDAIFAATGPDAKWQRCVDLGCGTGLMGLMLRPHVRMLEGCDLSKGMVNKASERGCYDKLEVADLVTHLEGSGTSVQHEQMGGADDPGPSSPTAAATGAGCSTGHASPYDLLVAADVFVYIGDLEAVMASAARHACRGALCAFSTESLEATEGYDHVRARDAAGFVLTSTGRYAHSLTYIGSVAEQHGWRLTRSSSAVIRCDAGQPVHGHICVLQLSG